MEICIPFPFRKGLNAKRAKALKTFALLRFHETQQLLTNILNDIQTEATQCMVFFVG